MRRLALGGILLVALTLAACGGAGSTGGGSGGSTISMSFGSFSGNTTLSVKAGDAVSFDDTNGGAHQLVIGTHGAFAAVPGAPDTLNSAQGVTFNGGDKQSIVFSTPGTYPITCLLHPSMQATVTVTQ